MHLARLSLYFFMITPSTGLIALWVEPELSHVRCIQRNDGEFPFSVIQLRHSWIGIRPVEIVGAAVTVQIDMQTRLP
jgi:hypothetical protein